MDFKIPQIEIKALSGTAAAYTTRSLTWITATVSGCYRYSYDTGAHLLNQCFTWSSTQLRYQYSRLPTMGAAWAYTMKSASSGYQVTATFLWSQKEVLAGGTIIAAALAYFYHVWKSRPKMPDISLVSSGTHAHLKIMAPKENPPPPDVTITFCVDESGSMKTTDRGDSVKKALQTVLENAQKAVNIQNGTAIGLALVGFEMEARIIAPMTQLTPTTLKSENTVFENLKKQITSLHFEGGTKILCGLEQAAKGLESAAQQRPHAKHFVVLLTDGDDTTLDTVLLSKIHKTITSNSAQLFAIGIGKEHTKKTLQTIANCKKGEYIDTTLLDNSIEKVISKIYLQAIATYQRFTLSAQGVDSGVWLVDRMPAGKTYDLGALGEGKTVEKLITIDTTKLKKYLDLSEVAFNLSFIDPWGRTGKVTLPWNPHSILTVPLCQGKLQ